MDRNDVHDLLQARTARLTDVVRASECDAFVLVSDATRHWLGMSRHPVVVVTSSNVDGGTWEAPMLNQPRTATCLVLGHDADLTVRRQGQVQRQLESSPRWVDVGPGVARLREVKDAVELLLLEHLHETLADVVEAVLDSVQTADREDAVLHRMAARLTDSFPRWAWLLPPEIVGAARSPGASGVTGAAVGTGPLSADVSIRVQGYGARVTRTLWIGEGRGVWEDRDVRLGRLLNSVTAGVRAGVASHLPQDRLTALARRHGFDPSRLVLTGHGIGLRPQEPPFLTSGERHHLLAGSVVRFTLQHAPDLARSTLLTVPEPVPAEPVQAVMT